MNPFRVEDKEKTKKERAKRAIALAMQARWEEAAAVNRAILNEFADDLEAYNRLGKALNELGRNREAKEAFQRALEISPHNAIARKNLERLRRLGDETAPFGVPHNAGPHAFIEESGKAGLTSLVSLASQEVLLKLSPGHTVHLEVDGAGLRVTEPSGEYVGRVEPKLASRLSRLVRGGNRYEATVTSVGHRGLTLIIRELYKDPSQADIVSFPSRSSPDYTVYVPSTLLGELADAKTEELEPSAVKDWSDDDTEPGDDDAYSPVLHRIIDATGETVSEEGEL